MGLKLRIPNYIKDPFFPFDIIIGKVEKPIPVHEHDFHEIGIVIKGKGRHIINGKEFDIREGNVFVIKENDQHYISSHQNLHICHIKFNLNYFSAGWSVIYSMKGFQYLLILSPMEGYNNKSKNIPLVIPPGERVYINELINYLVQEYQRHPAGYQLRIISLFTDLVILLSRFSENISTPEKGVFRLADAIIYIEQFFDKPINIEELASRSMLSPSAFCKLFKKAYGIPPLTYLNKLRIDHACRLIKQSDVPFSVIAEKSGFSELNYFSRVFKKINKITPSEYKKQK